MLITITDKNYNTSPNSPPNTQESGPNVKDSMSENINSENEVFNNKKIKKTEISFRDPNSNASSMINVSNKKIDNSNSNLDLSSEKVTKSSQSKVKINTEISNLNKSDNLSSNLKIKNIPDVSYKTKIIPEAYISNKNNIDFERVLYSKNARNRLQKNQIVEKII